MAEIFKLKPGPESGCEKSDFRARWHA